MIKILVWRCKDCGDELEEFYCSVEFTKALEEGNELFCRCGGLYEPFNLKNNLQRWRYADR